MNPNLNEKIYFSVDYIFSLISEILEKNGLKTSLDDDVDNIESKKTSLIDIVFNLITKLAEEKISEKDFCSSLQTQLKISKETSENILKEIKTNILPYAEKIKIGEQIDINEEKPITANSVRLIKENQIIPEKPAEKGVGEKIKLKENISEPPKEIKHPKEPDKYREPVE
ncbi:MAG: hypothetical protein AAB361_01125 [Patescibacteria group bacterium]